MKIRVDVDTQKAEALLRADRAAIAGVLSAWFNQGAELVKRAMQDDIASKAKQPTGQLAGSVTVLDRDNVSVSIGPSKDYGIHVDLPTGLFGPRGRKFEIKPRNKKALAFASSHIETVGGLVKAGSVRLRQPRSGPQGRLIVQGPFASPGRFGSQGAGRGRPDVAGSLAVVRSVMHPGHRGLHFIRGTAERVPEPLQRLMTRLLDEGLRRAGGA